MRIGLDQITSCPETCVNAATKTRECSKLHVGRLLVLGRRLEEWLRFETQKPCNDYRRKSLYARVVTRHHVVVCLRCEKAIRSSVLVSSV